MVDIKVNALATHMVQHDLLPDGTDAHPLLIECLMCYAGGPTMTAEQVEALFIEEGAADGHFAQLLARELGGLRKNHILVGGYPGEIHARPGNVGSVWRDDTGPFLETRMVAVSNNIAWYDSQGKQVNKDGRL